LTYDAIGHEKVKSDLAPLTKEGASKIIARVEDHLLRDPAAYGKPLQGVFKGLFRYRVGSYRVIYAVDHAERRVIILHVKHRKEAYR
jgi:mRNA interferase RelE/StbE